MSPEQLRGVPVDARSDVFAFGLLLYEMMTGTHPFLRRDAIETASAILNEPRRCCRERRSGPGTARAHRRPLPGEESGEALPVAPRRRGLS